MRPFAASAPFATVLFMLMPSAPASAQGLEVSGRVTDAAGKPLSGVAVRVIASPWAGSTDAEGRYTLSQATGLARPPASPRGAPEAAPGLRLQARPLPAGVPGDVHDLKGRRHLAGLPLAAGAYLRAPSVFATPTDPAAPAAKASAAVPGAWIQAWKAGYAPFLQRLPAAVATVDIVLAAAAGPDLGPNVLVFDPTMPMADIQSLVDTLKSQQASAVTAQFNLNRYALLFKPGSYDLRLEVGYYTQAAGLGRQPADVTISGQVGSTTTTANNNVTVMFWRGLENLTAAPTAANKTTIWAVSQAAPFRRIHVKGSLNLSLGGWASGGFLADSRVDGTILNGSQQQWFSRNSAMGAWSGYVWNQFFLGIANPPSGTWPTQRYTSVPQTPLIREKPFLTVDAAGVWSVFMPGLRRDAQGPSWGGTLGAGAGRHIPLDSFHIAIPGAGGIEGPGDAAALNAALAAGKHLLLTPGIYRLDFPVKVARPGTVVLGLGFATLAPENGTSALEVADVDGVVLAGLTVDAGLKPSPVLVQIGEPGSAKDHSADPTSLHDLFFRVGGPWEGSADVSIAIHSHDVIADHFWVWRADHGAGARWDGARGKNGLVVHGNDVSAYGMFVEHYQEYQTLWAGENGRLFFYQCEIPYDPPSQEAWGHDGVKGWAAYKVADAVKTHEAWGLGAYSYLKQPVVMDNAFEAPAVPGVKMRRMVTRWLNGSVESSILNVFNGTGGAVTKAKPDAAID